MKSESNEKLNELNQEIIENAKKLAQIILLRNLNENGVITLSQRAEYTDLVCKGEINPKEMVAA